MILLVCSGLNFTWLSSSPVLASKFFTFIVFSSFLLELSHLLTKGGELYELKSETVQSA